MKTLCRMTHVISLLVLLTTHAISQEKPALAWMNAVKSQGVTMDTVTMNFLVRTYLKADRETSNSLKEMQTMAIGDRLVLYLKAKKIQDRAITINDIRDFNWKAVAYRSNWVSVKVPPQTKISSLSYGSAILTSEAGFNNDRTQWVAVPAENFVLQAFSDGLLQTWCISGVPESQILELPISASKGCEIYINSDPMNAVVYFNGKKYHRETNTTCVREIGTWTVELRKDGFETWTEQRDLKSGEVWIINANLRKIVP